MFLSLRFLLTLCTLIGLPLGSLEAVTSKKKSKVQVTKPVASKPAAKVAAKTIDPDQYENDDPGYDYFEYDGEYVAPYHYRHCRCRCFEAVYEPEIYYHYYPQYSAGQLYLLAQHPRYYIRHLHGVRKR